MKIEYLNDANPLPEGHPHAGEIGLMIDHEDGRPVPQRVYAKDQTQMTIKLAAMYGNTQTRIAEVKSEMETLKKRPAPTSTETGTPQQTDAERLMQLTADLNDPAKAPKAILELVKREGVDLGAEKKERERTAELARLQRCANEFAAANPDYVPGPIGKVISNTAYAQFGEITTDTLQAAYDSLREAGVLPSRNMEQPQPSDSTIKPSAQESQSTRGTSTSVRPSSLGGGSTRVETKPTLTYEQVLDLASTPEYERRLREEPGFSDLVNAAFSDFERRSKRAG